MIFALCFRLLHLAFAYLLNFQGFVSGYFAALSITRTLSLREFAKHERANSWQSKGKFAFKFIDCHAVSVKTARNDGQKAFL